MRAFTVGRWPLAVCLLLGSCATAPPPPPPPAPAWTEVPRGVLDAFCARLHDEGISAETAVEVVRTTQALITPQTISGLAEAAAYSNRFDPFTVSEQANRGATPMSIVIPASGCTWRAVDENARRSADTMTIEFSSPFMNPFAHNAYGLLARVSLAGDSATWYWLPLAQRSGRWVLGQPTALAMR